MMPAAVADRDSSLSQAMFKMSFLCALCVVVIGIVLLAMANPAIADDLKASSYSGHAVVPVAMEPLPQAAPVASLATAPEQGFVQGQYRNGDASSAAAEIHCRQGGDEYRG